MANAPGELVQWLGRASEEFWGDRSADLRVSLSRALELARSQAELLHTAREALSRAQCKLGAYVGVCKGDKELTNAVLPMVGQALVALEDAYAASFESEAPVEQPTSLGGVDCAGNAAGPEADDIPDALKPIRDWMSLFNPASDARLTVSDAVALAAAILAALEASK